MSETETVSSPGEGKRELVRGTMGNKELIKSLQSFAAGKGQDNFDISTDLPTPEGRKLRNEWLLNSPDSSPEINNEILYAIADEQKTLNKIISSGDREGTLATISTLKGLIDKLEQGVSKIVL